MISLTQNLKFRKTKFQFVEWFYLYKINRINRADITDRNGNYISKSVFTSNIGIDPKLVKDKKKLLLKLKYTFPDKDFVEIEKKINGKKFFYVEKKMIPERYHQVKLFSQRISSTIHIHIFQK